MKELTDKVNMDNLSLIIKTLRSKATSSTFFNKSNTKLLLKLAVAFYQFKDKSLEELILLVLNMMKADVMTLFGRFNQMY